MNKINVRIIALVLLLTCSLLIAGCGNKETNANETNVKEGTTYKITWVEKGENHELEFSPNDYEKFIAYGGDKMRFYFEDDSKYESIVAQNGMCTIIMKDKSLMIISGDFVIEPVEGE